MLKKSWVMCLSLLLAAVFAVTAHATSITLNPTFDAYWESPGWYAGGNGYDKNYLAVHGQTANQWQASGLLFALSDIPDTAIVTSATFSVYLNSVNHGTSYKYKPNKATNLSTSTNDLWESVVGTAPANEAPIAELLLGTQLWAVGDWMTWDVLAGGWQSALDLQDDFLTLILSPYYYSATNYAYFASSETTHSPFLTIEYETPAPVPEPSTILLLGAGLAGLAVCRRKFKKKAI